MRQLTRLEAHAIAINFVGFCTRANLLTEAQAREELTRLMASPLRIRERLSYITMFRAGATFTMNRGTRIDVYSTFANAVNHATFEA